VVAWTPQEAEGGTSSAKKRKVGSSATSTGRPTRGSFTSKGTSKPGPQRENHDGHINHDDDSDNGHCVVITTGSCCSGMGTDEMALSSLGIATKIKFMCEIKPALRQHLAANFDIEPMSIIRCSGDAHFREQAPTVDVFSCGFPCQPFSAAGLNQGKDDEQGRGEVIFDILAYLRRAQPRSYVLENVVGLVYRHTEFFAWIIKQLRSMTDDSGKKLYRVSWEIINTLDHGSPQSRKRVYIVGTKASETVKPFRFPKALEHRPSLQPILDKGCRGGKGLPEQKHARKQVELLEKKLAEAKYTKAQVKKVVADIDASRLCFKVGVVPCITATRAANGGYWLHGYGRKTTMSELMRAQGMQPDTITQVTSIRALRHAMGNAMSQNVLARIFATLLPAVGLATEVGPYTWDKARRRMEAGQ